MYRKGFTIIELLVVIAILGILALLGVPKLTSHFEEAKLARIAHDVRVVENRVAEYLISNIYDGELANNDFFEGKYIYSKEGSVDYQDIREEGPYYVITTFEQVKESNSMLEGDFVSNNLGGVYYIENKDNIVVSDEEIYDKKLALGRYAGITTFKDGSFITWGSDEHNLISEIPTKPFYKVSLARYNGIALHYDRTITTWGSNDYRQVDDSPTGDNFKFISNGNTHLIAIDENGKIHLWGENGENQLNIPDGVYKKADGGHYHTLALREDGSIVGAGLDDYGQVSNIPSGNDFVSVAAGYKHSLALKEDGTLVSWGLDSNNEVSNTPEGSGFIQILASDYNSAALHEDGTIHVWGSNKYGQADVPPITDFVSIYLGSYTIAGLRENGTLVSWGRDDYGQKNIPYGTNLK